MKQFIYFHDGKVFGEYDLWPPERTLPMGGFMYSSVQQKWWSRMEGRWVTHLDAVDIPPVYKTWLLVL